MEQLFSNKKVTSGVTTMGPEINKAANYQPSERGEGRGREQTADLSLARRPPPTEETQDRIFKANSFSLSLFPSLSLSLSLSVILLRLGYNGFFSSSLSFPDRKKQKKPYLMKCKVSCGEVA